MKPWEFNFQTQWHSSACWHLNQLHLFIHITHMYTHTSNGRRSKYQQWSTSLYTPCATVPIWTSQCDQHNARHRVTMWTYSPHAARSLGRFLSFLISRTCACCLSCPQFELCSSQTWHDSSLSAMGIKVLILPKVSAQVCLQLTNSVYLADVFSKSFHELCLC